MRTTFSGTRPSLVKVGLLGMAALGAAMINGCSQTEASKPAAAEQMESGQAPAAVTGFFGSNYSLLQPGKEGQVGQHVLIGRGDAGIRAVPEFSRSL